jgi:hypothetical protein
VTSVCSAIFLKNLGYIIYDYIEKKEVGYVENCNIVEGLEYIRP